VTCHFGSRDNVVHVHFRDAKGTIPRFEERFLGEGNVGVVEARRTPKEVGFDGFIIDDHIPTMIDGTPWGHRGHTVATGYIMGLVAFINDPVKSEPASGR
jgi:mannonate dehydratase